MAGHTKQPEQGWSSNPTISEAPSPSIGKKNSKLKKRSRERALLKDISNNESPIVGVVRQIYETPQPSCKSITKLKTPSSGEVLLRCQAKSLLQNQDVSDRTPTFEPYCHKENTTTSHAAVPNFSSFDSPAVFRSTIIPPLPLNQQLTPSLGLFPAAVGGLSSSVYGGENPLHQVIDNTIGDKNAGSPERSISLAQLFESP